MAKGSPIVTIDLGSERVTMAVFSPLGKGGLALQAYASSDLLGDPSAPDAARIGQMKLAIKEMATQLNVVGQAANVSISGHSVITRLVQPPAIDVAKVHDIIGFEAQEVVPFPLDEVTWDYQIHESDTGKIEVVLVAVKTETVDELCDTVEEGGVKVALTDSSPTAIYNAFRFNYPEISETSLIIDIGSRSTDLILVDGNRTYIRSALTGGSTVSVNIAKEFGIDFSEANQQKIANGFVSLGGNYADHEDEAIAAMSKVIRNTMSKIHTESSRTISAYRQVGGNPPVRAFLSGAASATPYLREFFEDKLGIPVEYFNSLRNVSVGPKVDATAVGAQAHTLGENVGLALRNILSCPSEIDLPPTRVQARRSLAKKQPFFVTAGVSLLALLAAGGLHYSKSAEIATAKAAEAEEQNSELSSWDNKITALLDRYQDARVRAYPLRTATYGRSELVEIMAYLNQKIDSDKLWLVQFELLINGRRLPNSKSLFDENRVDEEWPQPKAVVTTKKGKRESTSSDTNQAANQLRIAGLYRDGQQKVNDFFQSLAEGDRFFELPKPGTREYENLKTEIVQIRLGQEQNVWAQLFKIDLPLKNPILVDEIHVDKLD